MVLIFLDIPNAFVGQATDAFPVSCRPYAFARRLADIRENFQGFTYCSIFGFQGSFIAILSSTATHSYYHKFFLLSTLFYFFSFDKILSLRQFLLSVEKNGERGI